MANVQNAESDKIAAEAAKIAEEICKEIPAYDGATTKEEFDDIVSIIESALSQSLAAREQRKAKLEAALRDMLEGHEDEDPNRPCIANARAALAATEGEGT